MKALDVQTPLGPAGDVWYRWTAACTGDAVLTTCGSSLDTVVTAYSGGCNRLTQIACNDDNDGLGFCPDESTASYLSFPATAGVTYTICVRGFNSDQGAFALNVQQERELGVCVRSAHHWPDDELRHDVRPQPVNRMRTLVYVSRTLVRAHARMRRDGDRRHLRVPL